MESLKERDNLENLFVDGRLKLQDWNRFSLLGRGKNSRDFIIMIKKLSDALKCGEFLVQLGARELIKN